ncbi:MAG: aminoglycoside phosphotransferase family protein [Paracoccaceae bacterium]
MTAAEPSLCGPGDREAAATALLCAAGWGDATRTPLAGDASARRYLRLRLGDRTAVLMDADPDRGEDVRPFLAVTDWYRARGLSAPEPLAADLSHGFLLLEDLGDALLARVAADRPEVEPDLYAAAVDLIAEPVPAPEAIGDGATRQPLAPYDAAVYRPEAALATDWYLPGATGRPVPAETVAAFADALDAALAPVADAPPTLVHRDYHAENLLWLPEREGAARIGLLDYQDALAGHPAYDLVSLLEDARRDTAPALRRAMLARFLDRRTDLDPDTFAAAYAALGAQRNLKILGIFARLSRRDGKPRYLAHMPRVWRHLAGDLAHPALEDLRRWVAEHLPPPEPETLARIRAGR